MSVKRKADGKEATDLNHKKPEFDFFAPKTVATNASPSFSFDSKGASTTRLTTWNVNGINSILKDEKKRKASNSIEH
jgi:AP endonuclease-1